MANVKKNNVETDVQKKVTKKKLDVHTMILVRSAVKGSLVYVSKKQNGYTVIWDDFGAENFMELDELMSLRNIYPRFFEDGWIVIDDSEVIEYLNVGKYYKNIIDINDFDSIFTLLPDELKEKLNIMPKGYQDTVIQRAKELMKEEKLYDTRIIKVIESTLGVELIEK